MAEDVRGIGTGTLPVMLFMVIERFKGGNPKPILDAAAYFESQPELVSRVNPDNKSPVR